MPVTGKIDSATTGRTVAAAPQEPAAVADQRQRDPVSPSPSRQGRASGGQARYEGVDPASHDSTAGAAPALLVEGLSLCHGRGPQRQEILDDVSVSLSAGHCLALVGPNGGGKTTLLRAVLGLERATARRMELAGLSPRTACRRGDVVGYVPQQPGVPAALPITARHAVRLAVTGRRFFSRGRAADLAWADEALRRLAGDGADDIARTPVNELSGGQLQQVFLARALANRPRVLLLDEPTVGLDRPAVGRLLGLLRELRRDASMAVLIATHDHLTAMDAADELIYLDRTVRYHGPTDALPAHLDARLCHHGDGEAQCATHTRRPPAAGGQ